MEYHDEAMWASLAPAVAIRAEPNRFEPQILGQPEATPTRIGDLAPFFGELASIVLTAGRQNRGTTHCLNGDAPTWDHR